MSITLQADAELGLGVGEFEKLTATVTAVDTSTCTTVVDSAGTTIQISANNVILLTDNAINTDVLGGNPQTGVRLLILLAEAP